MRKNELLKIAQRLNAKNIDKMDETEYNKIRKGYTEIIYETYGQYGANLTLYQIDGSFYYVGRSQRRFGMRK